MSLVQSYTERFLTDPADRLNAIAVISQKYGQILRKYQGIDIECAKESSWRPENAENQEIVGSVEYMAGLWHCKLTLQGEPTMFYFQLLWGTDFYKSTWHQERLLAIQQSLAGTQEPQGQSATMGLAEPTATIKHVNLPLAGLLGGMQRTLHYHGPGHLLKERYTMKTGYTNTVFLST